MRTLYSILIAAVLLSSCLNKTEPSIDQIISEGDLKTIRAKRTEIVEKQQEIADQLKMLDAKIAKLDPTQKIPLITTITASEQLFNHFLELQGNVQTKQNVLIYPEMSGMLLRVYVKEGQQVRKGQFGRTA